MPYNPRRGDHPAELEPEPFDDSPYDDADYESGRDAYERQVDALDLAAERRAQRKLDNEVPDAR